MKLSKEEKIFIEMMVGNFRGALEDIHSGKSPSSNTGDYSDVKVVSPGGEIPWNKLSRINQAEMGQIKDDARKAFSDMLILLKEIGVELKFDNSFSEACKKLRIKKYKKR